MSIIKLHWIFNEHLNVAWDFVLQGFFSKNIYGVNLFTFSSKGKFGISRVIFLFIALCSIVISPSNILQRLFLKDIDIEVSANNNMTELLVDLGFNQNIYKTKENKFQKKISLSVSLSLSLSNRKTCFLAQTLIEKLSAKRKHEQNRFYKNVFLSINFESFNSRRCFLEWRRSKPKNQLRFLLFQKKRKKVGSGTGKRAWCVKNWKPRLQFCK